MTEHEHDDEHDLGLSHDLPRLLNRRRALGLLSGAGLAAALAACGSDNDALEQPFPPGQPHQESFSTSEGEIPEETNGPYPADGTNGVNVLTESGIVRSDIRSSFGEASGVAAGIPLTVTMSLVDVTGADDPGSAVEGAAIYIWHCDRDGDYSMYSESAKNESYLRGVQPTDAKGQVTFTTIFPGAYAGRWPHIHFEVYPTLADAQKATNKQRTSQLAFPEDTCNQVYATAGYDASVRNMKQTSLDQDMVFSDGYALQMAKMTGTPAEGLKATLRVPI